MWANGRWQKDICNLMFHVARQFVRVVATRSLNESHSLLEVAFAAAVERASRADPRLALSHEIWDVDPMLLGVPGGVVDLQTGELRPSDPKHYISRRTTCWRHRASAPHAGRAAMTAASSRTRSTRCGAPT
jgi:putative DNA primase/helicase